MAAAPYESKGMPGCIWSTDVVHIVWDCYPAGYDITNFSFAMFVDSTDGTRTQAQAQFYELRRKLVDHYQWKSKK